MCLLIFFFLRHNTIAYNRLQYSVKITFICTGKSKKNCVVPSIAIFALLLWSGTESAVSLRYPILYRVRNTFPASLLEYHCPGFTSLSLATPPQSLCCSFFISLRTTKGIKAKINRLHQTKNLLKNK